jgi:hypothetical protein
MAWRRENTCLYQDSNPDPYRCYFRNIEYDELSTIFRLVQLSYVSHNILDELNTVICGNSKTATEISLHVLFRGSAYIYPHKLMGQQFEIKCTSKGNPVTINHPD